MDRLKVGDSEEDNKEWELEIIRISEEDRKTSKELVPGLTDDESEEDEPKEEDRKEIKLQVIMKEVRK